MDLPMANATLTRVQAAGGAEDYDYGGAVGSDKWVGSEGAYFTEQTERMPQGNESSVIVTRYLIVPADDLAFAFAEADVVTFTPYGGTPTTATVRIVKRTKFPGAPGIIRLILEDA